ncbi:MAG: prenyltransferase/squalene oxidase repeat-containing protein, partial [Terrimicrobiaceae bacterium]|nr:prenyltransferase/squalene oxidase repeat-containing protein [Terrimicrobiaceae bacterium]
MNRVMQPAAKIIPFGKSDSIAGLEPDVAATVARSQDYLLGIQREDGRWEGELTVDSTLCADYIIYMHWCGNADAVLLEKCAAHIRRRQLPDGGWNIYCGGPSEVNASIKGYFALKLAGDSPGAAWMREARANALRLGGIPAMNTFGKLYLALLGQFPWKYLPTIPPEMFLAPTWFFFNLYEMSSWSRPILAPLTILNHFRPVRQLPAALQLHELYPAGMENTNLSLKKHPRFWAWRNFFLRCDSALKIYDRLPVHPLRQRALKAAEKWMAERMGEGSDGLAAIFPAMLNAMMALRTLGYADNHPLVRKADRDFAGLFVDEPGDFRIQPCLSPVWDTAITTISLAESGLPKDHPALVHAAEWLEAREVRFRGDWQFKNPHPEASGWAFEHDNVYYPDTDDTMMVLMALRHVAPRDAVKRREQFDRALGWLLS